VPVTVGVPNITDIKKGTSPNFDSCNANLILATPSPNYSPVMLRCIKNPTKKYIPPGGAQKKKEGGGFARNG
jgi:hypothetical protein